MRAAILVGVVVIAAVSVWTAPVKRAMPGAPLLAGADAPDAVRTLFERSCQDCHSDRTRYPWYSYVAPVSLLVGSDVREGRARLNLSQWDQYTLTRRLRFLSEIANQVKEREMPLSIYTTLHHDARLSDADVEAIFRWTQAERLRLIEAARSEPRP